MSRRHTLVVGWLAATVVIVLFVNLGTWQLHRAVQKQGMLDAAAQVLATRERHPLGLATDESRLESYDWAAGRGEFASRPPLLLDNQQREGRVGVNAYRVFLPEQGTPVLVDLGWLPLPADRTLPAIARPDGTIGLQGLLVPPPSTGIPMGPGLVRDGGSWLLTRVDVAAIASAIDLPLAPRVLRLDPASPLGYERDLALLANTLTPDKHRAYALQWFALALAVLATALIVTFRKPRKHNPKADTP
ncbi:SURF1 family protein [Lysobacter sp. A421]